MTGTETPGGHLARLRVTHGERWRIDRTPATPTAPAGFVAAERSTGRRVYCLTADELDAALGLDAARRAKGVGSGDAG